MKREHGQTQACWGGIDGVTSVPLFPGIELGYLSLTGDHFSVHHRGSGHIVVINYCKNGRIGWKMDSGSYIYLGAGDFSVHTLRQDVHSEISLPTERYEGLSICIDPAELSADPPELLSGAGITGSALTEKLCGHEAMRSFGRNEQADAIFRYFYDQPEDTRLPYQKLKTLELLLYLYHAENGSNQCIAEYQAEQIEVIRRLHQDLLSNLDQRITIEALSKQYLMNPTTMKALFKSVYGTSIAAHMKEHRMQEAAKLLAETEMSIAEVALSVGYDSQSKFSTAFKEFFQMLPKEYRKSRKQLGASTVV